MRSRNLKPGFFKNEDLAALPAVARLLFAGLWLASDMEGRVEDRPRRIKVEILPYDDCDVDELLWQLHEGNFIYRYQIGEERFLWLPTFHQHQNPHPRETKSVIPAFSIEYKLSRKGVVEQFKGSPKALPSPADSLFSESLNPSSLNPEEKLMAGKSAILAITLVSQFGPLIHGRHPARKCSLRETGELLGRILKKHPESAQLSVMEKINENHIAYCESEDWTKDGASFCPGLDKWLRPEKERYLIPVDVRLPGMAGLSKMERYLNEH